MNTIEPAFAPLFTIEGTDVTPAILARFVLTRSFYTYLPDGLHTSPKDEISYEQRLERMFLETRRHLQDDDNITWRAANRMEEWFANLRELFYFYSAPSAARHYIAAVIERASRDLNDSPGLDSTL